MGVEEWRIIEEAPRYSVSDQGRVRNDKTGRILKPGMLSDGYLAVVLARDNQSAINCKVHRLVAKAFWPTADFSLEVNHNTPNGDKTDNRKQSLEWATRSKNMRHAFRNGLYPKRGGLIRIIETGDVFETQAEVTNAIGGDQSAVGRTLAGKQYRHKGYRFEYVS